jgi:predicted nucleotidyltransferase
VKSNFSFKYFDSAELPKLFDAMKRTFDAANVPFYLIGAMARDVWFLPEYMTRITRDVDWVAVSEMTIFDQIKANLIQNEGFRATNNDFALLSSVGTTVDLIPFSQHENRLIDGLKEVFERGVEDVYFDDGNIYKVATLPAIVILKLIAWDDRPEFRGKDLVDIAQILKQYFDAFSDDIYDNHHDLFDNRELIEIGAQVIGRKIKWIIHDSTDLKNKIYLILTNKRTVLNEKLAKELGLTEKETDNILANLSLGIF